jgi:hypothetical protein
MAAHDDADGRRVSLEIAARLAARRVVLGGHETRGALKAIEEAVEEFEEAVRDRGGDLMVDEGPRGRTTEPDDPQFALPARGARETVAQYVERLTRAADAVRRPRPDAA